MKKLTAEGCAARRAQLLDAARVDYLIINNPRHIQYLTGLYITPLLLSGWGTNFLVLDAASGKSMLVVHNSIAGAAKSAHVDEVQEWRWYDAATDPGTDPHREAVEELNKRLPDLSGKRIGAELGWLPQGVRVGEFTDLTPIFRELRRRKHPDELDLLREAMDAIGAGHRAARQEIRPGLTEIDMYNIVHDAIVKHLGYAVLLLGDFSSGGRPGGPPTPRVLGAGELMIFDLFPVVNGYRGDYTATLSVDRKLTEQQRALDKALNEALAAGEAQLRPGSVAGDVYRAVRDKLGEHGLAAGFPHHAGHGLGLGHPDAPYFVPNSREVLVAGDVVTLEPGWYEPSKLGARIERNYLITDSGPVELSSHQTTFA